MMHLIVIKTIKLCKGLYSFTPSFIKDMDRLIPQDLVDLAAQIKM